MNKANWFTATATLLPTLGLTYVALLQLVNLEQRLTAIFTFAAAGGYLLATIGTVAIPRALALIFFWIGHLGAGISLACQFIYDWNDTDPTMGAYGVQALAMLPAGWFSLQWWLSLDGRNIIGRFRLALVAAGVGFALQAGFAFLDHTGNERFLLAIGATLAAIGTALAGLLIKGVELQTIHTDIPKEKPQEPPTAD